MARCNQQSKPPLLWRQATEALSWPGELLQQGRSVLLLLHTALHRRRQHGAGGGLHGDKLSGATSKETGLREGQVAMEKIL
jgi:hypothetical protein